MEIEILEKLLLDIADAEKKQDEIRFQEHQAILKLKDQILALESICILHGIYDLPIWLKKDTEALFSEAVRFDRENMVQIPLKLRHER
jgi:hypothetical protein